MRLLYFSKFVSNNFKGRFWSKEFLAGLGGSATVILFLVLSLIQPMVVDNTFAISENSVQIGKIEASFTSIHDKLNRMDTKIENLDTKIDNLTIMMCDVSKGKHC